MNENNNNITMTSTTYGEYMHICADLHYPCAWLFAIMLPYVVIISITIISCMIPLYIVFVVFLIAKSDGRHEVSSGFYKILISLSFADIVGTVVNVNFRLADIAGRYARTVQFVPKVF